MLKRLLTLSTICIATSAYSMVPYHAPREPECQFYAYAEGYTQMECPNCHEYRIFPSEEFVVNRRRSLTEQQEREMVQAISTYDGDIVPGRMCPFCGVNLPTHEDFK
jgi:predicted RNA-binding Zn-ribbon protein involved in translation (DUF1610 family)